jgi:pSer/pThr/pTyr-binding forkhead associated (FHA) protein
MMICQFCRTPVEPGDQFCPHCLRHLDVGGGAPEPDSGTAIESLDDIRAAHVQMVRDKLDATQLLEPLSAPASNEQDDPSPRPSAVVPAAVKKASKRAKSGSTPVSKTQQSVATEKDENLHRKSRSRDRTAIQFRPAKRPPILVLCVLDDGRTRHGEEIRIRADSFVIGRADADLNIPHDAGISNRHAQIARIAENGRHGFVLRDLGSKTGTFLRVSKTTLQDGQELMLGRRRYKFVCPPAPQSPSNSAGPAVLQAIHDRASPESSEPRESPATLVELSSHGDGLRYVLKPGKNLIGTDTKQCSIIIADDLCVSPVHARFRISSRQAWVIENMKSANGVWIRVNEIELENHCEFQLGEQRFYVEIP